MKAVSDADILRDPKWSDVVDEYIFPCQRVGVRHREGLEPYFSTPQSGRRDCAAFRKLGSGRNALQGRYMIRVFDLSG